MDKLDTIKYKILNLMSNLAREAARLQDEISESKIKDEKKYLIEYRQELVSNYRLLSNLYHDIFNYTPDYADVHERIYK